jgi:carbon monoxide dehydrogenase subunit G
VEEIAMKWVKRIAIVLAVLLIVPMAVLLVMDHRTNAGLAQASVEINASPDQLWPWLDDGERLKQWVSWLVDVKYPDPHSAHGVGTKRIWILKDENNGGTLMQIASTFSEYAPPSRMTVQIADSDGIFNGEESYQLVDLGGGRTRVEVEDRAHYMQWFANLMEPLITPEAEKKLVMDLNHLKQLVETKAEAN